MREHHIPIYNLLLGTNPKDTPELRAELEALAAAQHTTLETILSEAEADKEQHLFEGLYEVLGSAERWQADLQRLIETGKTMDEVWTGLHWRRAYAGEISDELLAKWYRRFHWKDNYIFQYITINDSYDYILYAERGNLPLFRAAVREFDKDSYFDQQLFRRYATQDEWEAAVRDLLKGRKIEKKANEITEKLQTLHSEREGAELPLVLQEELIAAYGEKASNYLNYFVDWRFRQLIENLIKAYPDNEQLLLMIRATQGVNWSQFLKLFPIWAKLLYAKDAAFFGRFIWENCGWGTNRNLAAIRDLADWARRDGHRELFRKLAANLDDRDYWNADLRAVLAKPDLTSAALAGEMERLDVRRSGVWVYKVFIDDDNAAALYRRKPDQWREYVWRYLVTVERDGYPLLLQAALDAGDEDFYIRVFRRVATQESWDAEMERLYARDLPAERILAELEKRKPTDIHRIAPGVIHKFLSKYGEAVLPFFENYIDWTAPERLKALLALDLPRGDLLRELQAIARRQPVEFGDQADVWALQLYDMSPTFFSRFIARYLTRTSSETAKELLKRFEANGQFDLFEQLYPRLYRGDDWDKQILEQIAARSDDQDLLAALQRRTNSWTALSDKAAAMLYQRNPEVFREYLLAHVRPRFGWPERSYPQLEQLAKQAKDTPLLEHLAPLKDDVQRTDTDAEIRALAKQDLTWDALDAQARQISSEGVFDVHDAKFHKALLKRYGEALLPALIRFAESAYWRLEYLPKIEEVQKIASPALYWRYVFARRDHSRWVYGLKDLAEAKLSDEEFAVQLTLLTPTNNLGTLPDYAAEALYARSPALARPFIERFLDNRLYDGLFEVATQQGDLELQDYLAALALLWADNAIQGAQYEAKRGYQSAIKPELLQKIQASCQPYVAYLDALYRESQAQFVAHAAAILRHIRPGREGLNTATLPFNPIWQALLLAHPDDWRRDAAAIRDLLESPSFIIQIAALHLLSDGSLDAAARIVENLRSFRVLLLSNTFKDTKRLALECLAKAGRNGEPYRTPILELLQTVVDFTAARRSISDEVAVTMAHLLAGEAAPLTSP